MKKGVGKILTNNWNAYMRIHIKCTPCLKSIKWQETNIDILEILSEGFAKNTGHTILILLSNCHVSDYMYDQENFLTFEYVWKQK